MSKENKEDVEYVISFLFSGEKEWRTYSESRRFSKFMERAEEKFYKKSDAVKVAKELIKKSKLIIKAKVFKLTKTFECDVIL